MYDFVFFFQAEDGIRDADVTGVQTCALPIWPGLRAVGEPRAQDRAELPRGAGRPAGPGRPPGCLTGIRLSFRIYGSRIVPDERHARPSLSPYFDKEQETTSNGRYHHQDPGLRDRDRP